MQPDYKYYAFISYNWKDLEWGKKLQKKLEGYRLPSTLCNKRGWKRNPIKPIFFAPTDIQPGGLSTEIQKRLESSKNLIVICSPNSAKSEWVGKEIEYFHSLGRTENIYFFIVDGIPNSGNNENECYNPIIRDLEIPEILGVNIHEPIYKWSWLNKERAYVQLITKLLSIEFDSIWKRHQRILIEKIISFAILFIVIIASMFSIWKINQPANISIGLYEASIKNPHLPPIRDAIVYIELNNEIKVDTIKTTQEIVNFVNIPRYLLNNEARIRVQCQNFYDVDTVLNLTNSFKIGLLRNEGIYGNVHFKIFNPKTEKYVSGVKVDIKGFQTISDNNGNVIMNIPLLQQDTIYKITSTVPLISDIIHMPSGNNDVILVK